VEDVDATFAHRRDAGAATLREPADMPWGERVAFVRDPEGNVVALATRQS
jgi:lactoylglutathione lyase